MTDDLAGHIARLRIDSSDRQRAGEIEPAQPRALPGVDRQNTHGAFRLITLPLARFAANLANLEPRLDALPTARFSKWTAMDAATLESPLFFDLETCGFSGSPLFLIGLTRRSGTGWMIEQYFARNYGEEAAVLTAFVEALQAVTAIVTFNGKSFDWPFVLDRLSRHRIAAPAELPHWDLLHLARRRWAGQFENFRLQTLEERLCHRRRVADLGGREIAIAYHDYVRSGIMKDVKRILLHNALDVATMLDLTVQLANDETFADVA